MKTRTRFIVAAVAVGLIAAATVGCNHHRRHTAERAHKFSTHIVDEVLDELDATKAQACQIQALRKRVVGDA